MEVKHGGTLPWAGPGDGERGSITVLAIGFGALALALVLVIATATTVHLERKRLLSVADGAAAAAATAVDLPGYYSLTGEGTRIPLTDATVRAATEDYIHAAPASGRLTALRITQPTGSPDGVTAQVSLAAVAQPAFLPWALIPWSDGIAIRVTVTARAS